MKNYNYIKDQKELDTFLDFLKNESLIAIDTEFDRTKTYFAKLCLIQIASQNTYTIIDPLAEELNLEGFFAILQNKYITKIFHDAKQDIAIFYKLSKKMPINIFDTQIASMFCKMKLRTGYEYLCRKICNVNIDKTCQFSDWSKRPLSNEQLQYAITDVLYLFDIYKYLNNELIKDNALEKFQNKMKEIFSEQAFNIDLPNLWKKVRLDKKYSNDFTKNLQMLAMFREEVAIRLNIPKKHFIQDEALIEICQNLPNDSKKLFSINNLSSHLKNNPKIANELINLCQGLKDYK